ncbi:MAG: cytochrome B [Actinobacteria bacterium HGW-Actinobacteria-7]|jgi:Ni/Fe-hydrogenase 1 B-type cytochrome subunit|nr:MAG: cytochrome B [Actinobacteria bacterium HGW-Actinobacteria-7]
MSHAYTREMHPLAFVVSHWTNLCAMVFLTLSGLYIHYPIFPGFMGAARGTHNFWMFVLLINLVVRLVMGFTLKTSKLAGGREKELDIKNFLPQAENRHQLWPTIKYYLFLKKEHPLGGKYNSLQKFAYVLTVPLILLAAYTGFALWGPTSQWSFFLAGTTMVANWFNGGVGGAALMPMRIVHYWTMWAILSFTFIHVYLANIYGFDADRIMFAWKETGTDHA